MTPNEAVRKLYKSVKAEWKVAFFSAVIIGLLTHLPIMLSDIPNHDGLASMYFDQNMITSGRWFLEIACGLSSFYTIPWIIGMFSIILLGLTAAALTELMEIKDSMLIVLISGLLVTFPVLASNFAYVFTMDGYMLGLLLAVLAVLFVKKGRLGYICGGLCLGFSMGIYQAYLPVAIILSIYMVIIIFIDEETVKGKITKSLEYIYMGLIGVVFYYVALQILLAIQGKQLATYQGIDGMAEAGSGVNMLGLCKLIYKDFLAFTIKGNILVNNSFSMIAIIIIAIIVLSTVAGLILSRKWWKKPGVFVIIALLLVVTPVASNIILIISANVTYHSLMRYQWVVLLVALIAFCNKYMGGKKTLANLGQWCLVAAAAVLLLNYIVTDNISYSNLNKKYEKTYAYCTRLLDRIEQTEGYYQGIPVAMIGVVGDEQFPTTDLTENVTRSILSVGGDYLLYTGKNYQEFIKNYLGASLNMLEPEDTGDFYYSEEYIEMDSFPGKNSVKCVDGVIYVKTENEKRD